MTMSTLHHLIRRLPLFCALLLLSACAVSTDPLSPEERQELLQENKALLEKQSLANLGPMTLEDCIARAILANVDYRVQVMESDLTRQQFELSKLDMLPSLDAQVGGHHRYPENASQSMSLETRNMSLEPSFSQQRNRITTDLTLAWSLLDFGVSYYKARQESDKAHIREELQRKAQQQLVEQVRAAFWRAASAQLFRSEVRDILADARSALADARQVEERLLMPPLQSLQFQRTLLEVVRQLESLQSELEVAQVELLSLMGLPPGMELDLKIDKQEVSEPPLLRESAEKLVDMALDHRPELREGMYKLRISKAEITRSMLETLPGLSFRASGKYDSNEFLADNLWEEMSVQVTGSILDMLTAPERIGVAEAKHDLSRLQLLSLHMAVVTQVHVALRQYQRVMGDYEMAREISRVEQRISDIVSNQARADSQSQVENIRSRTVALFAELDRYRSYAEAQNAYGRILISLGLDILPPSLATTDANLLSKHIGCVLHSWVSGHLETEPCELATRVIAESRESGESAETTSVEDDLDAVRQGLRDAVEYAQGRNQALQAAGATGEAVQ